LIWVLAHWSHTMTKPNLSLNPDCHGN
jgi:hypothetical protein